jgi:Reverse transcriptase (RNA-dependent DNA polymerase)
VVEFDIRGLFDNLDHSLLTTALRKHCQEPWILLYVERWLRAPMQSADGQLQARDKGTPQGGVVSPILANLFLHYPFDLWVTRHLPGVRFARYADDAVLHCRSRRQAEYVLERIRERFRACNLELHPGKTRIVYCKDINRTGENPDIQFTFLGYTFRPRKGGGQVRPRLWELLADRQPRRPQGHAADDPGMADPTEERQESGRSFGHARTDPERMAAILRPFPRLGAQVGLASREPVPDRMADGQAQEAGGP